MEKFLVVGLGNPGREYENTRHNAGFMCVDRFDTGRFSHEYNSLLSTKDYFGKRVTFMKPQTYMNSSGISVSEFVNFYHLTIENVVVIFDDIFLPVGKIRIRAKGSCGGHNGIRNIIEMLGTDKIKRIKIGVGKNPENWDLDDWVLSKFSSDDLKKLDIAFENAKKSVELVIQNKILESMNLFN